MKRVLINLLAIGGTTLLMLSSCKKSDSLVTTNGGTPGKLTASTTAPVLDKTKLSDTSAVVQFSFTAPQYGYSAAVTNTLQIDAPGDNWKNPTSVTLGAKVLSAHYNTSNFNAMLLKLGLPAYTQSTVNVRIQHALSSTEVSYSNVLSLSVTPFNLISWIWVPGDYDGWNNNGGSLDSLVSPTGNGVYYGIINFPATPGQFKLLPVKGSWTVAYGDAGGGNISTSGGNITPIGAGNVLITVDLNKNTITMANADYYSVIGDAAQGWGTDVAMKYINDGNANWAVTLPLVSTGSFKIRQDDNWTNSWGIPKAGSAGDGVANTLNDSSNNNISIAASGNYLVTFNAPATAVGAPALATTTYTVTKK